MPTRISRDCACAITASASRRDQQARIFERFERGVEQRSGGFGIGLWVVKSICVAMGGTMSVESELGEGACFTVMLPRRSEREAVNSRSEGTLGGRGTQRRLSVGRPGLPGLDRILEGGLLASGVYIVQGPPGAGKTILANQACFHHASTGGHAVYVTLLAESHSRMFAHLRRMAFFDEAAIPDRVYYIGGYSTLQSGGLDALVALIRGAIQKHKATLLVVDGLISAQESAPTERDFKRFLHEIQTLADLTGCTVLLLTNAERSSGFFPEHTMVDGVLHLTDELSELRPLRHIRVLKLRGSAPIRGLHSVRITDKGFEVRPRIETLFPQGPVREERRRQRREAGVRPGRARRRCCAAASGPARSRCCWARRAAARPCSGCSSCPRASSAANAASISASTSIPRRFWRSVSASASAD